MLALLWLAESETSEAGTTTDVRLIGTTLLALRVLLSVSLRRCWQTAEQRCREVEAADVASVARLVRGVRSTLECVVGIFARIICMLWQRWHGQAAVGLGELRSPAVSTTTSIFVIFQVDVR